jgi:catechol 2,3-dioxygenase-like lactoylglutathione lyase family enzyme
MDIRIAVVSLQAEDVPAAVHFYRDVVGLPLQDHFTGDHPHFELGCTTLTILRGRPDLTPDPEPRFPVMAFSIPNLDEALVRLRSSGVELPWGVETNATGRWIMFHDPAGNLIEMVEFRSKTGDGL